MIIIPFLLFGTVKRFCIKDNPEQSGVTPLEKFFVFLCNFRTINTFEVYNYNCKIKQPRSRSIKMRMLEKFRRMFEIWFLYAMGIIVTEEPLKRIQGGSKVPLRITTSEK